MSTWTNWSGLATARPAQVMTPRDAGEVAEAVVAARGQRLTVKMTGADMSGPGIGDAACETDADEPFDAQPASAIDATRALAHDRPRAVGRAAALRKFSA